MQPPVPVLPSSFTLDDLALVLAVALVAGAAFLIARRLLMTLGLRLVARANTRLAAALEHQRVFPTLALLAPALIVAIATPLLQRRYNWTLGLLGPLLDGYVIVVIALTVHNLLGALDELITAQRTPSAAAPVRLAFRWLRLINLAVAVILALSVFTGVPVTWLLAVVGVIVATGSIVFGDMIYNLVALSILKQRKLVAKGDWLEVPALQINGQVSEVGSQLIEVQNWDNTLATVPPRYLVSNSFRNWQHMERLGTRRILRYLALDATTVVPLDDELLAAARAEPTVARWLAQRVQTFGSPAQATAGLTNVALYRVALMGYLASHPQRAADTIWRVTNEDAMGQGLPVLLLLYVRETEDVPYRLLDAELYEYALAAAHRWGLRVFQAPSGADVGGWRGQGAPRGTARTG